MGRNHLRLPDHLYLSPPSPRPYPSSLATAASLLSLKTVPYSSPAAFIQETSSTAHEVGKKIPGYQASAAFLTTLRANINIDVDGTESVLSTPDSLRPVNLASSVSSLPPRDRLREFVLDENMADAADSDFAPPTALDLPKPSLSEDAPDADAAETKDPNAIPPLETFPAEDDESRIEALRLVADSVAQQRQRVSRVLIFHPLTLALLVAVFGVVYKFLYKGARSDFAIIGTTVAGVIMAMLVSVRALGGPYITEAERVGTWRWLHEGRSRAAEDETGTKALGQGDEILVTKFGDDYIGAVIFRGVQPVAANGSKKGGHRRSTSSASNKDTRTEIRAWTVKVKYRNKGVGTELLKDAITLAHEKGWTKGGVDLAETHANSKRVLPERFNGYLTKAEDRTRNYFQKTLDEVESTGSKRGGKRRK